MRALISILLLLGAAGAIFVAGWIQILLPPATYGVLFSKTGGYDPEVMEPGVFVWRWERVIPNNVTLFLFEVQPRSFETRLSGELPSAEAVASMLPGAAGAGDFRYHATVSVTFTVRPDALPALVSGEGLTPEDLNQWIGMKGTAVGRAALELLQGQAQAAALTDLAALEAEILDPLAASFPELHVVGVRFSDLHLPDIEIYERGRRAYLDLMDAQHEARRAAVIDLAHQRERGLAEQETRRAALQVLREYGAVLQEYPVLIQFLALQNAAGRDAFVDLPAPLSATDTP